MQFQILGAEEKKDRWPDIEETRWRLSSLFDVERRPDWATGERSSKIYDGCWWWSDLKVIDAILNLIRCTIGSQWNRLSSGEIWWCIRVEGRTTQAKDFWTSWSQCIAELGKEWYSELQ